MDTKLATQTIRIQQWTEIIQDCINSGMRVDDYCEQHDITHHQYYYWLRKVKEHMLEQQPQQMVELKPSVHHHSTAVITSDFSAEAVITVGDINIKVSSDTSDILLRKLIEVIRHA